MRRTDLSKVTREHDTRSLQKVANADDRQRGFQARLILKTGLVRA
jgi:hypothetical protein